MDVNLPVWKYYEKDFVDPMYVPYQRTWTKIKNNCGDCIDWPVNTWQKFPIGSGMAQPGLARVGWGQTFQLQMPEDQCPMGWKKADCVAETGYCIKEEPEFEPVFYTSKAFIPKNQFFNGYDSCPTGYNSEKLNCPKKGCGLNDNEFSMRSISPSTGEWVTSYKVKPNKAASKYATAGTPSSYLA